MSGAFKTIAAVSLILLLMACSEGGLIKPLGEPQSNTYTGSGVGDVGAAIKTVGTYAIGTGGIAIDALGAIYIADFGGSLGDIHGSQILKVDPVTGASEVFAAGFDGATGNDFDSSGNLYQSSFSNGTLYKVSPVGETTILATGFTNPVGVVLDSSDTAFVANCGNGSISMVTSAGVVTTLASSALLKCANGITLDEATGNLYVANFSDGNVLTVTPDGGVSILATLPGGGNGHPTFNNGALYVAARNNNQIYRVGLDGSVALFFGDGSESNNDGVLEGASIKLPNDLVFSNDGTLYLFAAADASAAGKLAPSVIRVVARKP